jgi:hypothetical protein
LCADNAAMVAWAGAERLARGWTDGLDVAPRARWPLDPDATPALGGGKQGAKAGCALGGPCNQIGGDSIGSKSLPFGNAEVLSEGILAMLKNP